MTDSLPRAAPSREPRPSRCPGRSSPHHPFPGRSAPSRSGRRDGRMRGMRPITARPRSLIGGGEVSSSPCLDRATNARERALESSSGRGSRRPRCTNGAPSSTAPLGERPRTTGVISGEGFRHVAPTTVHGGPSQPRRLETSNWPVRARLPWAQRRGIAHYVPLEILRACSMRGGVGASPPHLEGAQGFTTGPPLARSSAGSIPAASTFGHDAGTRQHGGREVPRNAGPDCRV